MASKRKPLRAQVSELWRRGPIGKMVVVVIGLILSCVCLAPLSLVSPRTTPTPRATSEASEMGEVATATLVITKPTMTPTARPTLTPTPTATETSMPTETPTGTPTATLRPTSAATRARVIATPTLASSGRSNPSAFQCVGGCATPPAGCLIKGNVNSKGEKIYHTPSSRDYKRTDIKLEEGDRWFCTEAEAQAAGFRAPQR